MDPDYPWPAVLVTGKTPPEPGKAPVPGLTELMRGGLALTPVTLALVGTNDRERIREALEKVRGAANQARGVNPPPDPAH